MNDCKIQKKEVVIKKYSNHSANDPSIEFINECILLSFCNHKMIISMIAYDKIKGIIILPFYSRRLNDINEPNVKKFMKQIAQGIGYLHSNNIIHCDLKPSNILVTDSGNIKIIDFGNSCAGINGKMLLCTITYRAPEMTGYHRFNNKVDIWSYGCIVYYLQTKMHLFGGYQYYNDIRRRSCELFGPVSKKVKKRYCLDEVKLDKYEIKLLPKKIRKFIEYIMIIDPEKRPSINDILKQLSCNTFPEPKKIIPIKTKNNKYLTKSVRMNARRVMDTYNCSREAALLIGSYIGGEKRIIYPEDIGQDDNLYKEIMKTL